MISTDYVGLMARYNSWQNSSIYAAADALPDAARREDRGVFFGSVHKTLCHILWADQMWMSRLMGTPKPEAQSIADSSTMIEDWSVLQTNREKADAHLQMWADGLTDADISGELVWFSGGLGRELSQPRWMIITHLFNHQTHHRGQVHAMLTQAGAKPDDTDIPILLARES